MEISLIMKTNSERKRKTPQRETGIILKRYHKSPICQICGHYFYGEYKTKICPSCAEFITNQRKRGISWGLRENVRYAENISKLTIEIKRLAPTSARKSSGEDTPSHGETNTPITWGIILSKTEKDILVRREEPGKKLEKLYPFEKESSGV